MTAFRVDLEQVELLLERMTTLEEQLLEVHDDVEARITRLRVVWTGLAADEHQAAYRQWSVGAQQVDAALARLRQIVRIAHGNYDAAVLANRAMWPT